MTTTPKTLTVTECHQLLDALMPKEATHKQHAKAVRNYTMALLMLDAGLRVGEVVKLLQTDLYYINEVLQSVLVREDISKNHKERTVPLSSRIQSAIGEMYKNWWSDGIGFSTDYAFYQTNPDAPLTTRQVERIIRKAALKCLGRPIHPHVLRHTFASRLMRTVNARIVQELLGHKHMTSTQIYTHPNQEDLKKAIDGIDAPSTIKPDGEIILAGPADAPDRGDTGGTDSDVR